MDNRITVDTAKDWLLRWRKNQDRYNDECHVKGFTIPILDLEEVKRELGVTSVRAYLGITADWEEKIVVVGIDEHGNDMIDEAKGQYCYDMIVPCPPMCGTGGLSDFC